MIDIVNPNTVAIKIIEQCSWSEMNTGAPTSATLVCTNLPDTKLSIHNLHNFLCHSTMQFVVVLTWFIGVCMFVDVLFGVPMKDSGIKRFFIRNRQRVISFAVTLVFDKYNAG